MNGAVGRVWLVAALLWGCSLHGAERAAKSDEGSRQAIEVRREVKGLEDAWNRGDVAGVIRQYHPSVYVRVGSEQWEYAKQVDYLKEGMKKEPRPQLRIDIRFVRPLGEGYAVVNGSFHMISQDGSEEGGPFTALWMRSNGIWQCIYTHS